jgi:Tol biopolymer transport system component
LSWQLYPACPGASAATGYVGRIVFATPKAICAVDLATGSVTLVFSGATSYPTLSPDGRTVVFDDYPGIGLVSIDGTSKRDLDGWMSQDSLPGYFSWLPDGRSFSFDYLGTVYVIDHGSLGPLGPRSVFEGGASHLSWSPDGRRVTMLGGPSPAGQATQPEYANHGISVVNSDGTGARQITSDPAGAADFTPAWSPDGSLIAFARDYNPYPNGAAGYGEATIFLVRPDGTGLRPLLGTGAQANDIDPAWAPDGRAIAFIRQSGTGGALMVVRLDGTGLTTVAYGAQEPSWGPMALP